MTVKGGPRNVSSSQSHHRRRQTEFRALSAQPSIPAPPLRNGQRDTPFHATTKGVINALCFDIDDLAYALKQLFDMRLADSPWLVDKETFSLLEGLADLGLQGTMFVPGYVAERFPTLVRAIADAGHHIASHGMYHQSVESLGRKAFFDDVSRCKKLLEDLIGKEVDTYKAPRWTITSRTLWAYDELIAAGYRVDNSAMPSLVRSLGHSAVENRPLRYKDTLTVIPATAVSLLGKAIPMNGGFYSAYVPVFLLVRWYRRLNQKGLPFNYYTHPFEFSPAGMNRRLYKYRSWYVSLFAAHTGRYRSYVSRLASYFDFGPLEVAYRAFLGP